MAAPPPQTGNRLLLRTTDGNTVSARLVAVHKRGEKWTDTSLVYLSFWDETTTKQYADDQGIGAGNVRTLYLGALRACEVTD